jgi:hypothetical protein
MEIKKSVISADMVRLIYDDRILPNVYAHNVVRGRLRNEAVMSFLPFDLRPASRAFPVPIEYWTALKRDLAKSHRRLFVVLIPNRYTIYQRFLADQHKWPMYGDELLSRNEAALRSLKIPVVNLAPALRGKRDPESTDTSTCIGATTRTGIRAALTLLQRRSRALFRN